MTQVVRKQKGTSGFPNIGYRHLDGQVFPAMIVSTAALGTPGTPTVTPQGTTGAAAYSYRISAVSGTGETLAGTAGTTATGNAVLSGANFNRVTWTAVSGAAAYKVYGRTAAGELFMATVVGLQFDDTGAVTPAGALPGGNTASAYTIRVPALRQGPSGGTNYQKVAGIGINRTQTGTLVVGR
jgi:hypothetical protein